MYKITEDVITFRPHEVCLTQILSSDINFQYVNIPKSEENYNLKCVYFPKHCDITLEVLI